MSAQLNAKIRPAAAAGARGLCGAQLPGHWQKFGKPFGRRRLSVRLHPAA